jgi:hypothetical protein
MKTYEQSRDELSLYLVGHGFDRVDEDGRLDYVEGKLMNVPVSVRFRKLSIYAGIANDEGVVLKWISIGKYRDMAGYELMAKIAEALDVHPLNSLSERSAQWTLYWDNKKNEAFLDGWKRVSVMSRTISDKVTIRESHGDGLKLVEANRLFIRRLC